MVVEKNTGNNQLRKGRSTKLQGMQCKGFHILAKPIGPTCNMNCGYCFYSEKATFFAEKSSLRMNDSVLESFISKYIRSQDIPEISFVWQGGEPTLLGLDYFNKVISFQKKYADGKRITNSLQTNGTLLNAEWCRFLKAHDFLVGLSIDGPEMIHDHYRVYQSGRPTFYKVLHGLSLLQKYGVNFNVLACVTKESSQYPLEIYSFFKQAGVQFIQFSPIVERIPNDSDRESGLRHAAPPILDLEEKQTKVTSYSVEAEAYGDFLIQIFDEWVKKDVGRIYVMNFEWALQSWIGLPSTYCFFARQCGRALAIEHNGDIYACDHYVYPDYRLGNIVTDEPKEIVDSALQVEFGRQKEATLPLKCRECEVLFACNGECAKHRFLITADNEPGLNYLCSGYKKYFRYIHPYMKGMKELIENDLPADRIMKIGEREWKRKNHENKVN